MLTAVALAYPEGELGDAEAEACKDEAAAAPPLPFWRTRSVLPSEDGSGGSGGGAAARPAPAPHIVWRLDDAPELLLAEGGGGGGTRAASVVDELFGGQIGMMRPVAYQQNIQ